MLALRAAITRDHRLLLRRPGGHRAIRAGTPAEAGPLRRPSPPGPRRAPARHRRVADTGQVEGLEVEGLESAH